MYIYLDNLASTPVDSRVIDSMLKSNEKNYANPSSVDHDAGEEAQRLIENARANVANYIQARSSQVIFTSGATEAINIILQGFALRKKKCIKIAYSPIEHRAVLDVIDNLYKLGMCKPYPLKIDSKGNLDLEYLNNLLITQKIDILCVMSVNNEIGIINPIQNIAKLCENTETKFFTDASQALGRIHLEFNNWGIDFMCLSAHKIYGPKGIGAIIAKNFHDLSPIMYGSNHERGLRPGTLNTPNIVGFGKAIELRKIEGASDEIQIKNLRNKLEKLLSDKIPEIIFNANISNRIAGISHFSIPKIKNKAVIARLRHKIAISTGAACTSGIESPSHVLLALGLDNDLLEGAFRFGIGKLNTSKEIDMAVEFFVDAVFKVQNLLTRVS